MRHFATSLMLFFATVSFACFDPNPNQWYRIILANSGLCLRPTAAQSTIGAQVEQAVFNSNDSTQLWKFKYSTTAGYWCVKNKNGNVLDVQGITAGSKVVTNATTNGANQQLCFKPSPFLGYFYVSDLSNISGKTNLVFDIQAGNTTAGTKVLMQAKKTCGYENQVVKIQAESAMDHLVFWNTLGSSSEITHSRIGLDGTCKGGSFVTGKFGKAYQATVSQDTLVSFPETVLAADSGCIEFWAQLSGYTGEIGWGSSPLFLKSTIANHQLNGNDGMGNGGICGGFDGPNTHNATGTGQYDSYTYEGVLGNVSAWHHYALVWNNNGIKSIGQVPVSTIPYQDENKTMQLCRVAVYLDGVLNSTEWKDYGGNLWKPSSTRKMYLIFNENKKPNTKVTMDNIKVWNYPKTDFSDRFAE